MDTNEFMDTLKGLAFAWEADAERDGNTHDVDATVRVFFVANIDWLKTWQPDPESGARP